MLSFVRCCKVQVEFERKVVHNKISNLYEVKIIKCEIMRWMPSVVQKCMFTFIYLFVDNIYPYLFKPKLFCKKVTNKLPLEQDTDRPGHTLFLRKNENYPLHSYFVN
jgi:hypothetical protein